MVSYYDFSTDEDNRESIPASGDFPFVLKLTEFSKLIGGFAAWHWHDFFEITIPHQDGLIFQTPNGLKTLMRGEAVFANNSTLHTVNWEGSSRGKTTYTIFFDKTILTGSYGSIFDEKYVMPVSMCRDLESFVLRPDHADGLRIMTILNEIIELFIEEPFGYELSARSLLSEFWLLLLRETEEFRTNSKKADPTDSLRMKQMMNYIHDHFSEKIYLEEIAASADISIRECSRCFKRQIGLSPMDYLNQYRVRIAADELRSCIDSISLIGERCGFTSDSYFGKIFRQYMSCTPRDYRREMRGR